MNFIYKKIPIMNLLLFKVLLVTSIAAFASESTSKKSLDGIPYRFEVDSSVPIYAIGDIHGSYGALFNILKQLGLINDQGNWSGSKAHVVFLGDTLDKGPHSRLVLNMLTRLHLQSLGKVHVLLGNHEIIVTKGYLDWMSDEDLKHFKNYVRSKKKHGRNHSEEIVKSAFSGDSYYAKWLRNRNTMILIGNQLDGYTFFLHGGIEERILSHGIEEINNMVRRWFKWRQSDDLLYHQAEDLWAIGFFGPLWTRALAEQKVAVEVVESFLKNFKVNSIVIGHSITESRKIEAIYDGKVIKIDTEISKASSGNGKLSALFIKGKIKKAIYFNFEEIPEKIIKREEDLLRQFENIEENIPEEKYRPGLFLNCEKVFK